MKNLHFKSIITLLCAIFSISLSSISASHALAILHYEDVSIGQTAVTGGISLLGYTGSTTVITDAASFNTLLNSQVWDLVIYGEQDNEGFSLISGSLTSYVNNGGKVIGTTYIQDSGLVSLLEATAVSDNGSTIVTDGHVIYTGIGSNLDLDNPGWGTYNNSWNPTGSAIGLGELNGGSAVILGNNGNTLLNGPLFDSFLYLAQAELFIANEIEFLLPNLTTVSEPAPFALFGLGIIGLIFVRKRK